MSAHDAQELADKYCVGYFETSAKLGSEVEDVFSYIGQVRN